jgi:hypothetical protein
MTFFPLGVDNPAAGLQLYVLAPLAIRIVNVPEQIDMAGLTVIVGEMQKFNALVAAYPLTSIVIFPVVEPSGTEVTMLVAVGVPIIVAVVPLNFTMLLAAIVLKFAPMIVTLVPTAPLVGVKLAIEGGTIMIKSVALVATCPLTSKVIFPVVAPVGTEVTMLVGVGVPIIGATVPLNFTMLLEVVVLKFVPVIVTVAPTIPLAGVKLAIVGGTIMIKSVALVATCPLTSKVIFPVVAPVGTKVTMLVDVGVPIIGATVPLNFTMLLVAAVLKFVPVIVTFVPTSPLVGVKLAIVGVGMIVKSPVLITDWPPTPKVGSQSTVIEILPDEAVAGTLAVILVDVLAVTVAIVPLKYTKLALAVVL